MGETLFRKSVFNVKSEALGFSPPTPTRRSHDGDAVLNVDSFVNVSMLMTAAPWIAVNSLVGRRHDRAVALGSIGGGGRRPGLGLLARARLAAVH